MHPHEKHEDALVIHASFCIQCTVSQFIKTNDR